MSYTVKFTEDNPKTTVVDYVVVLIGSKKNALSLGGDIPPDSYVIAWSMYGNPGNSLKGTLTAQNSQGDAPITRNIRDDIQTGIYKKSRDTTALRIR